MAVSTFFKSVIPAYAGIRRYQNGLPMDSRFRGNHDGTLFPLRYLDLIVPVGLLFTCALASAAPAERSAPTEQVIVTGSRVARTGPVLPSDVTIEGSFGQERTVLDTPRTVTTLTSDLIERAGLVELRDLQRVAPNLYGANTFGAASLPSIRGQLGEIFQDGLRRQGGNNGLGLPLSFNAFEQIDVIKGPPPVVLGPTQRVGGFLNLTPKRPDLEHVRADLRVQGGTWERYRQQLDYSTPIAIGRSGVRFAVENRDENSFYDFAAYESQDVYAAYRLHPDAVNMLDVNFEYFNVEFTDNAGFNRATQDLIDRGIYLTGQGVQPGGSSVPGPGAIISPTGGVRIPRSRVYTDPADRNSSESYALNARVTHEFASGWRFANRTIYQHLEREEVAANSFVEIIDGADTVENRAELIFDSVLPMFSLITQQTTDLGLDFRFHDILGFSQFTTEADNPVDLTGPVANRRIPLTPAQTARLVELRPGLFVSPGAQYDLDGDGAGDFNVSDTTDSTHYQVGVFLQQDIRFTPRWSALVGLRGDWYDVTARDGAPPPAIARARDSANALLASANLGVEFKPVPDLATYFAVSYSESTSNSLGGGFVLGADNRISAENFDTASRLLELGVKYAPAGAWYADAAIFDQTRNLRNRDGSNSGIKTHGVETQIAYRPDRHLYGSIAASYLSARFDDSAAFQDSRTVLD
ncbi:MAG: TonB-dependent receptor, partial [Gammaproteobacteria bacterium]